MIIIDDINSIAAIVAKSNNGNNTTFINLRYMIFKYMSTKSKEYSIDDIEKAIKNKFNFLMKECDIRDLLDKRNENLLNAFVLNLIIEQHLQNYYWYFIGLLLDKVFKLDGNLDENEKAERLKAFEKLEKRVLNDILSKIAGNTNISQDDKDKLKDAIKEMIECRKKCLLVHYFAIYVANRNKKIYIAFEKIWETYFPDKSSKIEQYMKDQKLNEDSIFFGLLDEFEKGTFKKIIKEPDDISEELKNSIFSITNSEVGKDVEESNENVDLSSNRGKFLESLKEPLNELPYKKIIRQFIKFRLDELIRKKAVKENDIIGKRV